LVAALFAPTGAAGAGVANLFEGSCFCSHYVAKAVVAAGRQGSIINIASGAVLRVSPVGVRPGEGLLTEPTAATQPRRRQPLFMPHTRLGQLEL